MAQVGLWILGAGVAAAAAVYGIGLTPRTAPPATGEPGTLARYDLARGPAWTVPLPAALTEISGLAFTADGRLLAHGDEDATVWELDPRRGTVRKTFALSSDTTGQTDASGGEDGERRKKGRKRSERASSAGTITGDFEDLAIVGDRFFLVTSRGTLYEFREGSDGARLPSTARHTGLDGLCEVEGLAHDAPTRALLLLCKENLPKKSGAASVVVWAWSLDGSRLEPEPRITVDYAAFARGTGDQAFNGSGMAFAPDGRSLVLVAGPQQAFAEIRADGRVVDAGPLARSAHRQPEGIAFAPDGTLLIADEGAGGAATLSGYPRRGKL
jgi:uncharacterized protein YjiK